MRTTITDRQPVRLERLAGRAMPLCGGWQSLAGVRSPVVVISLFDLQGLADLIEHGRELDRTDHQREPLHGAAWSMWEDCEAAE